MPGEHATNVISMMRKLWAALVVAHFAFLGLLATGRMKMPDGEHAIPYAPAICAALSLFCVVNAIFLPTRTFDRALGSLTVPATDGLVADPDVTRVEALRRFQRPLMMGLALSQSISLFGLYLAYVQKDVRLWAPFFAVGIGLALSKFPRIETIDAAVERVKGVRFPPRSTS